MLIVAMLAQTTTAVPAQRLLFPQHWLLAGWDMVDEWAAQPVQSNRRGCRHHRGDRSTCQKLATPRAAMKIASVLLDASTD